LFLKNWLTSRIKTAF